MNYIKIGNTNYEILEYSFHSAGHDLNNPTADITVTLANPNRTNIDLDLVKMSRNKMFDIDIRFDKLKISDYYFLIHLEGGALI